MFTGTYFEGYDKTEKIDSVNTNSCSLRVDVKQEGICTFFYSLDGKEFLPIGKSFAAKPGVWIGAKVGLFCINPNINKSKGYADFDWFKVN